MPVAVSAVLDMLALLAFTFALIMAVSWIATQLMDLQFARIRPPAFGRAGLWLTSAFFAKAMLGQPLIPVFFHAQEMAPDLVSRAPRALLDAVLLAFATYRGVIAILYAKMPWATGYKGHAFGRILSWLVIMMAVAWCDTKLADESLIVAIALIVTTTGSLTMRAYFFSCEVTEPVLELALREESAGTAESRRGERLAELPSARTLARALFVGGSLLSIAAFVSDQLGEALGSTVPVVIAMVLSMFFDRTAERVKAVRGEFPDSMTRADRPLFEATLAPPRFQGRHELEVVRKQVQRYLATGRPSSVISLKSCFMAARLLAFTVQPGSDGTEDEIVLEALGTLTAYYWHRARALGLLPGPVPTRLRDSDDLRMLAVLSSVMTHEIGHRSIPETTELEKEIGEKLPLEARKARSILLAMSQEARESLGWSWQRGPAPRAAKDQS